MKIAKRVLSVFILFSLFNCIVYGQLKKNHQFILYLNTPSATKIVTEKSDELGIGHNSWMADFGMEFKLFGLASLSGGIGGGSVKDYNTFSQSTTMGVKESSFNTYSYNTKIGLWCPDIQPFKNRDLKIAIGASGGIEGMAGRREIDNCADCAKEKYKFNAGTFVEPEINFFFFQNLVGIGTSYRYYFTSLDLEHRIVLLKLMLRVDTNKE